MPPKFNANDPETAAQIAKFKSIGLPDAKATEVARSSKQAVILSSLIDKAGLVDKKEKGELDDKISLILALCVAAASASKLEEEGTLYALGAILDGRLKSNEQVSGESITCLECVWSLENGHLNFSD